jgi:hypothetical protein
MTKYPREFFEINLRFTQKVSQITGDPIEHTLLHYTNFYIRFGLGRDFDPANSIWQQYLEGLHQVEDITDWTYHFYLKRQDQATLEPDDSPFGCFSYTILDNSRMRLHFHNHEAPNSPLSRARIGHRLAELTAMFACLRSKVESSTHVMGASWLYNLEAYRRLFPPKYLAAAKVLHAQFDCLALWGQFIDHRGRIKEALAAGFLNCLEQQQNLKGIESCFPFQVLHLESPIVGFYEYYGV